ncbi:MAG TPA: N-acetylmuramoyl-L-alanine amidase [Candidatus Binatia bacterium]|nr:N-acetylmuramoyl-L-alanine amidase [Candidatus Binatia bacterium]
MSARGLGGAMIVLLLVSTSWAAARLPTITHDGRQYVELSRVAASLQTKGAPRTRVDATAASTRAHLRSGDKVVTLTRNWSQVLVNGKPVMLDAPVRVRRGVWLVPESFVGRVVPTLMAGSPTGSAASRIAAAPVEVGLEDVRVRSYPSFTRIVVETSAAVTHRIESSGPKEARVRLVGLGSGAHAQEIADGLIAEVRLERAGSDGLLRVVYEGAAGTIRTLTLADPPRLVLDVARPVEPSAREGREQVTPLKTIVLDAGHGGHDSGATGPTGLMEKDLVLDVTRRVTKLVEARLGIKVRLTRDADHFVTLRDRTSYANRERADLFVSIHANAHREAAADGVETYFLSSEATDSAARQVAALENGVVQLEQPAGRTSGQMDIVKAILWDLAQSEFQLESSRLAEVVHDSMTQTLRISNRGVKQAGFYVLGGAAMPAILIEIGFVTNPREERRLKDSKYRDEIARAIFAGLAEYKRAWDQRARAAAETPAVTRAR